MKVAASPPGARPAILSARSSSLSEPRDRFEPSRHASSSERMRNAPVWWVAGPEVPAVPGREGSILNSNRILKRDQYPGVHQSALQGSGQPPIPGAPNYRNPHETTLHGLGQPTIQGLRAVLAASGAGPGGSGGPALWINLREEPVIYIDGQPLCLRDRRFPLGNLTATSISGRNLEEIEENLRQEVLAEAERNHGRIALHDESADGRLTQRELLLDPERVQTPRQIFDSLRSEGYRVSYHRVPISDEKAPEPQDFDELVRLLKDQPPETPRIFNCQAGRGRTTTGMVIADLVDQARTGRLAPVLEALAVRPLLQEHFEDATGGKYTSLQDVARSLSDDPVSHQAADRAIDRFDHLQNLRRAVLDRAPDSGPYGSPEEATRARGRDFLERYFLLVRFAQYLAEQSPNGYAQPFTAWVAQQPGLYNSLELLEKAVNLWHSAFAA
ncbi:MAG: hypothetical protein HY319_22145 [Armatimonadetes bacterium]|nr:hypothetical protein [Armatimonadota bacterium]